MRCRSVSALTSVWWIWYALDRSCEVIRFDTTEFAGKSMRGVRYRGYLLGNRTMAEVSDIEILREAAAQGRIHWHQHALERFLERGISLAEVVRAIMNGEVIEVYAKDRPYASCLIFNAGAEPVHVVAAADATARICHVVTAYRPDLEHFEPGFRTRRRKP